MTGGAGPDDESLGEFGRIARYLAPLAADPGAIGLVDDAAELGHGLIATADAIVEGVHFLPSDPPELIARKLLRVNLSDLAAKGATPLHYLLTMALPARCDDRWVERFAAGLAEDQQLFGIVLMGGDSVSTPGPVTLSVTAIGRAAPGGMVRRGGARAGDELWVSGTIGDGALGLLAATGQLMEPDGYLAGRYRLPEPRVALGPALAGLVHAMMDVSDGLVGDLEHMATASGAAATVDAIAVPLSDATAAAVASDPSLFATVLTGGDDYELLFAAPAAAAAEIRQAAAAAGVPVVRIGRVEAGAGVRVLDRDGTMLGFARTGWRHG